jgi:1,4-alpha-glucan branching enzyme
MPKRDQSETITDYDLHLFNEGTFLRAWDKFGGRLGRSGDIAGAFFTVWAPNAEAVSVIGDFNDWNPGSHYLNNMGSSGVWTGFVPGAAKGNTYKYFIRSRESGYTVQKTDPYGLAFEMRPKSASVLWDLDYSWGDGDWMEKRGKHNALDAPMSIYEVHLGSWRRSDINFWLSYRDLADQLPAYVKDMGFTHVEFLPVMEHPFDGSWGYQCVGYFAPTSRFGTPQDFMYLIDRLHAQGIGVILDWAPGHFPKDEHGLAFFDGTHLYEHADPLMREQKDWNTLIFNYGRHEVKNFLMSNAMFWLDEYHVDGLRVDAVASMLYLDYSREKGEWIPNKHGGRENLEAIDFIKRLNEVVYEHHPDCLMIAEESTSWAGVTRPTYLGGLGFGLKWNMGWMHDVLEYMSKDPLFRSHHHDKLTFGMLYAHHENFLLPFSHDEAVHGKGSMLGKMPGDSWQQFAGLRLLYGFMYAYQGKKLLFMGGEFGQGAEWDHDKALDWDLLRNPWQQGMQWWVRDLNRLLRTQSALYELDFDTQGFCWIDCNDSAQSVISFFRRGKNPEDVVVCVCNFTPTPRNGYRIGVPFGGAWREILNSDAQSYGGGDMGNSGVVTASDKPWHNLPHSLELTVPPLAVLFLKR